MARTTTFVAVLFLNNDCLRSSASCCVQVPWSAMIRYAAFDTIFGILLSGLNGVFIVSPSTPFSFCHTVGGVPSPNAPPAHTRKFACP